jgi:hypothetical protein
MPFLSIDRAWSRGVVIMSVSPSSLASALFRKNLQWMLRQLKVMCLMKIKALLAGLVTKTITAASELVRLLRSSCTSLNQGQLTSAIPCFDIGASR